MEHYDIYKKLKDALSLIYKGISIERILALDIWSLTDNRYKNIKVLCRFFCYADFKFISKIKHRGLFTSAAKAKNHRDLFNSMSQEISLEYEAIDLNKTLHKVFCISFKNIFYSIKFVYAHLKNFDVSFWRKLVMAASYCHVLNTIDFLLKIRQPKIDCYLAYSSAHYWENLLCQFFRLKGIPTYSLQHGTNFLYKKNIPIDCINYDNIESDYYLCWGEYTRDELLKVGIGSERLPVAGYPRHLKRKRFKQNNSFKKCIVLLSRAIYDEVNMKLLYTLLSTSGMTFYLKLHYTLDETKYEVFCNKHNNFKLVKQQTLYECIEQSDFDFSIVINTTAYYEVLSMGMVTLRFTDELFDDFYGYDDLFYDLNSFNLQKAKIKQCLFNGEYENHINQMLKYAIGYGIYNYREILMEPFNK